MKRLIPLFLAVIFILGSASLAAAGDVKIGGEMYLNGYYSTDDAADNLEYSGWFKLKLTQDVSDIASWGVTLNFDYPENGSAVNSWKSNSNNTVKLDDAFVKLKFGPIFSIRVGRFESVYDEKNKYFAGEWDSFKQPNSSPYVWALTNWKSNWRERNAFGLEFTEKPSGKLSLMETLFFPENGGDLHYGIKAGYDPNDNFKITGSYFRLKDNQQSALLQCTYKKDTLSMYGLFDRQFNETAADNDIIAFGAAYAVNVWAVYAERYVMSGETDNSESKLGFEWYPGKNLALYVNLIYPDNYESVIRTGLALTF